ncbi:hypothetical protein [Trujillonella endophytica]|uniref:Uncharacterized protein n=1 Tax=Trujillonella endophytica TaxID=673521 RepID=A0A1H8SX89_9ACTN|nr:hypothetical protein [Trujillella endophytica]SEO83282.1 hypothetical protein SAMN05660991_01901 [Trujillella endophytica]
MTQTSAAGDGVREELAFGRPVERDGVTVVPAAAVRTHRATRADGGDPQRRRLDASLSGGRPLGAFVLRDGGVRWHPVVDATRVLTTAELVVGAVLVARQLAARPGAARADVTMGPGGWVSMKGGRMAVRPARRLWRRQPTSTAPAGRRPWWARLLAATTLESVLG